MRLEDFPFILDSKNGDFNTYTYRPGAYETAMPLEIASWAPAP